jgi:hypothetical protein
MLTGTRSEFNSHPTTGAVDQFDRRFTGDLITAQDWNKEGDAIYKLEQSLIDADESDKTFRLNPDTNVWMARMSIGWFKPVSYWLSVTGKVVVPVSACTQLGTFFPLRKENLVKVQHVVNMPAASRSFNGSNMTTSIWCPCNNPTLEAQHNAAYTPGTLENKTHEFWRTIYVGLSFDGYDPPDDLNTYDQYLSIFIESPREI